MRHEWFQSIPDALASAVCALETQPGPLPAHKAALLHQLRAEVERIEAARIIANSSMKGPFGENARQANRKYSSGR